MDSISTPAGADRQNSLVCPNENGIEIPVDALLSKLTRRGKEIVRNSENSLFVQVRLARTLSKCPSLLRN